MSHRSEKEGIKVGKGGHCLCFKQPDFSSMIKNKTVVSTLLSYPDMAKARILQTGFRLGFIPLVLAPKEN